MSKKAPPKQPNRDEVRARLKAFLQQGQSDDVASVLVHALNHRAEKIAEKQSAVVASDLGLDEETDK